MGKVLIVGCGYVGSALAQLLRNHGVSCLALTRQSLPPIAGLACIQHDLATDVPLVIPQDVMQVVYLVAAKEGSREAYERAYVQGLKKILHALRDHPMSPRVIFVSSTAVYGQNAGEWVDEATPTCPKRFNGEILLQAEEVLSTSGLPHTVVRFAGIYGPGRTGLLRRVQQGQLPAKLFDYTNRIHLADCAGILHFLLQQQAYSWAPVYLGVDHEPVLAVDVVRWLYQQAGFGAPRVELPEDPHKHGNKRCSNKKILHAGYRFHYPSFREGYQALLPI